MTVVLLKQAWLLSERLICYIVSLISVFTGHFSASIPPAAHLRPTLHSVRNSWMPWWHTLRCATLNVIPETLDQNILHIHSHADSHCLCLSQDLLERSSEPLSFVIFVPEWRDPPTPALTRMEASRFRRHQMIVTAFEHEYRSGAQHICKRSDICWSVSLFSWF